MTTLADNRIARHDYTIIDEFEAGIVLNGQEVKSAKLGQISLKGSYVHVKNNELFLVNAHISPYSKAVPDLNYNPTRDRKLLLNKKEIAQIGDRRASEGLAIIPLSLYTKKSLVKVRIALAKGKRKHDKRESIKKRETNRKIQGLVNR